MFTIIKGIGLLIFTLALFSLFSLKMPKGQKAMSGLADAAVATFLVEAIHTYISGNLLHVNFLGSVGGASGTMGGVAAVILVCLNMEVSPVYAVAAGVAVSGYGILPGFIAGYLVGFIAPIMEKKLPEGLNVILGALVLAPLARIIALGVDPLVNATLLNIGGMISVAAEQSPLVMGFLLGGIMKMICTSPLSSMALTAMLGLKGLAMGIAAIACVGGSFTNGMVFHRLKYGNKSNVIAVMLEPLTQAPIVTSHPIPIYCSNFFGGGFAGLAAAHFKIINNAPGTASPIPGLLAPFGFNNPKNVIFALVFAVIGGLVAGYVGSSIFKKIGEKPNQNQKQNVA
ncbi:PTS sugar transporter subunit IIC [Hathewaya limosa]|uniref:Fructose-specific phosphotransferase system IIC component n=1 Tax=Hathewaya limosa TaxID=1536 RepID=A0ABU0JNJ0_HATLI|nr:PTS sugar transporter subunit IIC [Hathewaya limosa]MDQ0478619.1 fructose-specific phosphotransferase system IIC component [Hathewaya limosa]